MIDFAVCLVSWHGTASVWRCANKVGRTPSHATTTFHVARQIFVHPGNWVWHHSKISNKPCAYVRLYMHFTSGPFVRVAIIDFRLFFFFFETYGFLSPRPLFWVMVGNIRSDDVFICMYVLLHNACIACVLWQSRVAFWSWKHACFVYYKEYRVGLFYRRLRLI